MRLALIRQCYTPFGGAERFLERAVQALLAQGVEITLMTRSWCDDAGLGGPRFFQHVLDPAYAPWGGRVARDRSFARAVQVAVAQGQFDITQTHERIPGCMVFRAGDGVHAAWLDHRARIEGPWRRCLTRWDAYHRYVLRQERAMFEHPRLQKVICNSVLVRDECVRYYGLSTDQLVVIENGVDLTAFHPRLAEEHRQRVRQVLGIPQAAPVFLQVGGGFVRKGVGRTLAALSGLQTQGAHLIVLGRDRTLSALQRQAIRWGLGGRVHFLGAVEDVKPYLGAADGFVLPTLYDPMPNAALEALAAGLPVLTSTTCGIADRIVSGENGFVCDALDIPMLRKHLEQLAEPGCAAGMRAAARSSVEDLSLEAMSGRILALYQQLIAAQHV